jgi:rhodanese-related sulfurtransferase
MQKTTLLPGIFAILLMLNLPACAAGIPRHELLKQIQENRSLLIVDVRSRSEYDRGHIPGAIHSSFFSIGSGLQERKHQKNESLVLYCEHGPRAGIASLSLFLSGYKKIYSLEEHMNGWRKDEFPIEIINRYQSNAEQ